MPEFLDHNGDVYDFDLIQDHGESYISITIYFKRQWLSWSHTSLLIDSFSKNIVWDDCFHPISNEAKTYIEKVYKNKAFL